MENYEEDDTSNRGESSSNGIPTNMPIIQQSKKLRTTVLAMLQSASFNLHELSSIQSKVTQSTQVAGL